MGVAPCWYLAAFATQYETFAHGSVVPTPAPPVLPLMAALAGAETMVPTLLPAAMVKLIPLALPAEVLPTMSTPLTPLVTSMPFQLRKTWLFLSRVLVVDNRRHRVVRGRTTRWHGRHYGLGMDMRVTGRVCGCVLAVAVVGGAAVGDELPVVTVDRDNVVVSQSCRIRVPRGVVIADVDRNGVIQVGAGGITIEFEQGSVLRGGAASAVVVGEFAAGAYEGTGVRVNGHKNVTIKGARVEGYRTAIWASQADGLTVDGGTLKDLRRQRLMSTPREEAQGDWLWPHNNDLQQWRTVYGAAVYVQESSGVAVHDVTVRKAQNGILLDRVTGAKVYDNDCSFLSGWGVGLWRSSGNVIARNALDFCVRGYSHDVYNRGQDSAGIIMFEQCNENVIAKNSATHCGDGLFAFAGREALGDVQPMPKGFESKGKGCNNNLIMENDFSYAAAHGLELTFSFGNRIIGNTLVGNAICGIWGGYSRQTLILKNTITHNGLAGKREGGGINIEHGEGNTIAENVFGNNTQGVSLWWDDDKGLLTSPWCKANGHASADTRIVGNRFSADTKGIVLEKTERTSLGKNTFDEVAEKDQLIKDEKSDVIMLEDEAASPEFDVPELKTLPGTKTPVGARAQYAGRDKIIMTPDGPWDFATPMVRLFAANGARDEYEVYRLPNRAVVNVDPIDPATPEGQRAEGTMEEKQPGEMFQRLVVSVPEEAEKARAKVAGEEVGGVYPYKLTIEGRGIKQELRGTLLDTTWTARFFRLSEDPVAKPESFDEAAVAALEEGKGGVSAAVKKLAFQFGNKGPSDVAIAAAVTEAKLPADKFGMRATSKVLLPGGRWRIVTRTDDGVRVNAVIGTGEKAQRLQLINNWSRNAPITDICDFEVPGTSKDLVPVELTVRYFELDGWAEFAFQIVPSP